MTNLSGNGSLMGTLRPFETQIATYCSDPEDFLTYRLTKILTRELLSHFDGESLNTIVSPSFADVSAEIIWIVDLLSKLYSTVSILKKDNELMNYLNSLLRKPQEFFNFDLAETVSCFMLASHKH